MLDDAVLTIALTSVMALQHFPRATDDWEAHSAAQTMWAVWKTTFRTAHTARFRLQASTGSTRTFGNAVIFGISSAVTAPGPPTGIKTVLNNLALAATNDNTTINFLVESNKQMAALLAALSAKMGGISATGMQPAAAIVATPVTPRKQLTAAQLLEHGYDPAGYCWLHGYKLHKTHTSASCKTKKDGHKDGATRADTMGGKHVR